MVINGGKIKNRIRPFFNIKALKIFPTQYDLNFRLASAYVYRCESEFENCNKAKEVLNKRLEEHPNNSNLLKLKEILEFEYQDN